MTQTVEGQALVAGEEVTSENGLCHSPHSVIMLTMSCPSQWQSSKDRVSRLVRVGENQSSHLLLTVELSVPLLVPANWCPPS